MSGRHVNWAAFAFATAIGGALLCLGAALFAREGHVFSGFLTIAVGALAGTAYSALALRQAEQRLAKLSEELTGQSRRLLRLENRASATVDEQLAEHDRDLAELKRATGALADVLGGQDSRLSELENAPAGPRFSAPPLLPEAMTEAHAEPVPQVSSPPLATREDFARAASAILGRLAPPPLGVVQSPTDDAIVDALEAGGLELWLEPIVTLPQRRLRLYAALPHLRTANGETHDGSTIRPVLARRRRLARLDAFALSQSLLVASHLAERGRSTSVCVRLSGEAIGSASFLTGASSRLATDRQAAERLLIEIDWAEAERLSPQEQAGLEHLRSLGVGLALGSVSRLDLDWTALARRGFAFAMVEMKTILAPRPHATTSFLVAEAAKAGIGFVATGVGKEPDVPDLLDFDVPLASGPALAPARAVRAEVLEPPAPAAPLPVAEPEPDSRSSFRDFLRRAG